MPKEKATAVKAPRAEVQAYVDRLIAERPPLTSEQCRAIASILNR